MKILFDFNIYNIDLLPVKISKHLLSLVVHIGIIRNEPVFISFYCRHFREFGSTRTHELYQMPGVFILPISCIVGIRKRGDGGANDRGWVIERN